MEGKAIGGDFLCAAVSPRGKWIYCVGEDGVCYVFDAQTGQLESVLQVADREVRGSRSTYYCIALHRVM